MRTLTQHPVTALHKSMLNSFWRHLAFSLLEVELNERELLVLELLASEHDVTSGLQLIDQVCSLVHIALIRVEYV